MKLKSWKYARAIMACNTFGGIGKISVGTMRKTHEGAIIDMFVNCSANEFHPSVTNGIDRLSMAFIGQWTTLIGYQWQYSFHEIALLGELRATTKYSLRNVIAARFFNIRVFWNIWGEQLRTPLSSDMSVWDSCASSFLRLSDATEWYAYGY